jgi:hypothetical protein
MLVEVDQIAWRCGVSRDFALRVARREGIMIRSDSTSPRVAYADADRLADAIGQARGDLDS